MPASPRCNWRLFRSNNQGYLKRKAHKSSVFRAYLSDCRHATLATGRMLQTTFDQPDFDT